MAGWLANDGNNLFSLMSSFFVLIDDVQGKARQGKTRQDRQSGRVAAKAKTMYGCCSTGKNITICNASDQGFPTTQSFAVSVAVAIAVVCFANSLYIYFL